MGESICWHCQNAVPDFNGRGCSWSRRFIPVEGWEAKFVSGFQYRKPNSYEVIQCPEYLCGRMEAREIEEEGKEAAAQGRNVISIRSRNQMGIPYRALSVWQPYASLLVSGKKEYETRSWNTSYRGPIVICSTKTNPYRVVSKLPSYSAKVIGDKLEGIELDWLPLGCVIGIVELTDCLPITQQFIEELKLSETALGDFQIGHYAWCFGERKQLNRPVPVKGNQGLWTLGEETRREINRAMRK